MFQTIQNEASIFQFDVQQRLKEEEKEPVTALWPVKEYPHFLLCQKASCLYCDVREQDSPGGSADDSADPTKPQSCGFSRLSRACVRSSLGFLGAWNVNSFLMHPNTCMPLQVQSNKGSVFIERRCLG